MNKLLNHFKNNLAIYLILLTCLIIIIISLCVTNINKKNDIKTVDTSMFKVLSLDETLKRFDEDNPTLLVIGLDTCQATVTYGVYLQIAQAKYGFNTYYLDLSTIDMSQKEQYDILVEKLDMEYNFQGNKDTFGKFIGSTPMTVIIKDHKMVYGYIGSMSDDTLGKITKIYGIATRDYEE